MSEKVCFFVLWVNWPYNFSSCGLVWSVSCDVPEWRGRMKDWRRDFRACVNSPVVSLSLRLPRDGVHDGVLWVHADWCVVLGVNDGGLSPRTLHLDGLVGGQGRVFQSYGVEAGGVLHAVSVGVRGQWVGEVVGRFQVARGEGEGNLKGEKWQRMHESEGRKPGQGVMILLTDR